MKLAKIKNNEIDNINLFFRELSWLAEENYYLEDIDFSDYELLSKFNKENLEDFIKHISKHAKSLFWEKAIMNLQTLLDNCADPDNNILDFNKDIQKGLNLLQKRFIEKKEYPEDNETVIVYVQYEINKTIVPILAKYIKRLNKFSFANGHFIENKIKYWYHIQEQYSYSE